MDKPKTLQAKVLQRFADLAAGNHDIAVRVAGQRLRFRARIVPGATRLVFTFHGAINRQKRRPPVFNSFFPGLEDTHQIAISDPSLGMSDAVRIAWFAGHAGFNTQGYLRTALKAITHALKVTRTIYFGNSGGGFAALYYAHFAPGSIALVSNPQTNILRYSKALVANYRTACWPELQANEELADATCTDVTALYAQGMRNTVIYLQSMGDRHQSNAHMLPFMGAIAGQPGAQRLLLHSDFTGEHGHVIAPADCLDWVRAATRSPTDETKDLLDCWHDIRNRRTGTPRTAPGAAKAESRDIKKDVLAVAERLRVYRESLT